MLFSFLKNLFFTVILVGYKGTSPEDRVIYATKTILSISPLAFLLDEFNTWFLNNTHFFIGILYAMLANIIVGAWYHHKVGDFKWKIFFIKNIEMWVIILLTYPLLEIMNHIVKTSVIGEIFKIIIQLATLLYPISKVLKNTYILSNRQFPPAFIMERIYEFKKTGDLDFFLAGKKGRGHKRNDFPEEEDYTPPPPREE